MSICVFVTMRTDDPLVASILDGSTLRLYLEDEDDFALLAENLFTELDVEDKGKIKTKEIQTALDQMGVEMGIPPPSGLPFYFLNCVLSYGCICLDVHHDLLVRQSYLSAVTCYYHQK